MFTQKTMRRLAFAALSALLILACTACVPTDGSPSGSYEDGYQKGYADGYKQGYQDAMGGLSTSAPTAEIISPTEDESGIPTVTPTLDATAENGTQPSTAPTVETDIPTNAPTDTATTIPTPKPSSPIDHMADLDFGGQQITISLSQYTNNEMPLVSTHYIQGPKRVGADTVLNEIYKRNDEVTSTINVTLRYAYTNYRYDEIELAIRLNFNGYGSPSLPTPKGYATVIPDIYIDQARGLARAQIAGYLANVSPSVETSYIDLSTTSEDMGVWYAEYMNAFNFNSSDKLYLMASDYFMDVYRHTVLTAVNLTDFKAAFITQGGTDLLYDTVLNGKWTTDQMITWSNVAFTDTGTKKGSADIEDELGSIVYADGASATAMLATSGVSLFDVSDDGKTWKVEMSQDDYIAIDQWLKVVRSTGAYLFTADDGDYTDCTAKFTDGTVLFMPGVQLFRLETEEFKNMADNKCVIPYPKAVESDDYAVTTADYARVGAILKNSDKIEATTAWVQASTLASKKVIDRYNTIAIRYKYGTEYGTTLMMDLVHERIAASYSIVDQTILDTTGTNIDSSVNPTHHSIITTPGVVINTYSSKYASVQPLLREALNIYTQKFNLLK